MLREFAFRADREVAGHALELLPRLRPHAAGHDRLARRPRARPARRALDARPATEWEWLEEHVTGDFDHLLIGTSLPFLLTHGLQSLEAWNEAVCNGAWGKTAARVGEQIRQAVDLEHWAAFGSSLDRIHRHGRARSGPAERAPASIVALSGDVHHAYLARGRLQAGHGDALGRLPGDLLAVPQPARRARADDDPLRVLTCGRSGWATC